ncbi:MAG TPA: hypothetical protein VHE30_15040 [Polyangiaceae bacterium]|nr:hypothetical protein [Polyangiaceae bacterium]
MYRKLDSGRIVETAERLRRRIAERFPDSGLSQVAAELEQVTREASSLSAYLRRPHLPLRVASVASVLALASVVVLAAVKLQGELAPHVWSDWVQGLEALVNDVVFVGVAAWFLLGLEVRRKRARALDALHVLRSLAHIVDMHQLTKDPESLVHGPATASSPERRMTAFELTRYLDYSTELLAIVSKVAALYVQEFSDPVTVNAASDVEDLAVNLSRTIWQKIVILDRVAGSNAIQEAVEPT